MAANEINLTLKITEKGNLKVVGQKAEKAAEGLDKTSKSARTADRNLKGAAQASANGSKNFSKMAQGITGGLVPAYATLAANIFAITAAFNFLKRAADVSVLIQAQESYAQSTGVGLKGIANSLREASGQMLTFRDAASAAAIGVAKGFSSKQLEDLAVGARKAAAALGRDFEDAFDRLVRGTSKAEPELLDELGITLRLERATKEYAASVGKNVKELTAYERSQAVLIETQRQLNEQFGDVDAAINPFQQLAVTFNDIVKSATQFLLPVFEGLANIINRSAGAAVVVFGALAVSIAKAAFPIDAIKEKFGEFQDKQAQAITDAEKRVERYTEALRKNALEIEALNDEAAKSLQKNAQTLVRGGGKDSKILQKVSKGEELTGVDKANLRKALKSAEKQYLDHGKIKTGIFKGADIKIVRNFQTSLAKMDVSAKKSTGKLRLYYGTATSFISLNFAKMSAAGSAAFAKIGSAAQRAGGIMNRALSFAGIIGVAVLVIELFVSLRNNIYDVSLSVIRIADKVFQGLINGLKSIVTSFYDGLAFLAAKAGLDTLAASYRNASSNAEEYFSNVTSLEDRFTESTIAVYAKSIQNSGRAATDSKEAFDAFKSSLKDFNSDFEAASRGMAKAAAAGDTVKESLIRLNAAATSGMEQKLNQIFKITDVNDRQAAYDLLKESILEQQDLFPRLAAIVSDSSLSYGEMANALMDAEKTAGAATAAQTSLREAITSTRSTLQNSNVDLYALREAWQNVNSAADRATATAAAAGETFDGVGKASDNLGTNIREASLEIERFLSSQRALNKEITDQNIVESQLSRLTPELSKYLTDRLNLERMVTQEKQLQLDLAVLQTQLARLVDQQDTTALQDAITKKQQELAVLQQKIGDEEKRVSDIGRIGDTAADAFESSFINAFSSVIQGTMSVKEAFASMAKSVLQALAQIIAKLIAVKLLEMAISFFNPASGGTPTNITMAPASGQANFTPGAFNFGGGGRYGGVMTPPPGYRDGGIAEGRDGGYPTMLHGTEAVVPLPHNRHIPVELKNGGNQNNNVVVNVSVDSDGQASQNMQSDGQQGANLGKAIAAAVQQEIMNQKRNGGMLSPYGAS